MAQVLIVAGSGPSFGSGHMVRMGILCELLRARGIDSRLLPLMHEADPAVHELASARVIVLDARDSSVTCLLRGREAGADRASGDPGPQVTARIIAIDNLSQERFADESPQDTLYFDTIPHPRLNAESILENVLLGPDLLGAIRATRPRGLLIYAPTERAAERSRRAFVRAGWVGPVEVFTQERPRSRALFVAGLSSARLVATHYGMTMLEAWRLGTPVLLLPVGSAVHAELSRYAQERFGIPFVEEDALARRHLVARALRRATVAAPVTRPGAHGFDRLLALVEEAL